MTKKRWASFALATTLLTTTLTSTISAEGTNYKVKPGDTLWKIKMASSQEISISQLIEWNNLSSDMIYPDQLLHVSNPGKSYTVKRGDTLFKIAQAHHVLVSEIKELNQLTSDYINIGQKLNIPSQKRIHKTYTVKSGDILAIIAKEYGTTVESIKKINNLSSNTIYIGQVLHLTEESANSEPSFLATGTFPLKKGSYSPYSDTWGNSRTYGEDRGHEGTDIMAPEGTPIYSATNGTIVNIGWLELGGWRIAIKSPEGYNLYYAHMSKYAPNMKKGSVIKEGQVIGYVGSTGYGPEGTSNKFDSHLHFGIYDQNWDALNPYDHLRYWEGL